MPMVIEDSHLFVIQMTHYIFINRMIFLCTRSLNGAQKIYLYLYLTLSILVFYNYGCI